MWRTGIIFATTICSLIIHVLSFPTRPGSLKDHRNGKAHVHFSDKAQQYRVNGSALPETDFDIGESYAGNLPIDADRSLFFWFLPSQNPLSSEELVVWLNGGPGCSSLIGFTRELGPISWRAGMARPGPNTWAWNRLTNVVFIDQPVGTGFSQGTPTARSEQDVVDQFLPFWKNFIDLFGLHGSQIHLAGESYAGMYCPYIAAGMLDQNDTSYFNVTGMMLFDPVIQQRYAKHIVAWPFAQANRNLLPMSEEHETRISKSFEACGFKDYLDRAMTFPPNLRSFLEPLSVSRSSQYGHFLDPVGIDQQKGLPKEGCDLFHQIDTAARAANPCFNIYDIADHCPRVGDVLGFPTLPANLDEPYFNRSDVKKAIHAPADAEWRMCSGYDRPVFLDRHDNSTLSGLNSGPLMEVIEATNNVIIGHGALDMILLSNATLLTLNNLTWNGEQGFWQPPIHPLCIPNREDPSSGVAPSGITVDGKWISERGLTFAEINLSGHEVPQYRPAAAFRLLEKLLGRIEALDEQAAFSVASDHEIIDF